MKKYSLGFSLAEVLLSVAIVSVISTLGFNVAKKNLDQAYDAYIYTGYDSISTAISNTKILNYEYDPDNYEDTLKYMASLFNTSLNSNKDGFKAPNGIEYIFDNSDNDKLKITMKVPTRRTSSGTSNNEYDFVYLKNDGSYPFLIPPNNLINRKDLIAFYIEREADKSSGYDSFNVISCQKYGPVEILGNSCSGIIQSQEDGILKHINPRRVF